MVLFEDGNQPFEFFHKGMKLFLQLDEIGTGVLGLGKTNIFGQSKSTATLRLGFFGRLGGFGGLRWCHGLLLLLLLLLE